MSIARGPVRPAPSEPPEADPLAGWQLEEARAAIRLVAMGTATRVALHGLGNPDAIAAIIEAEAASAQVSVRIERHGDARSSLLIGPRDPRPASGT